MITVIIVVYKSNKEKLNNVLDKISENLKIIIIDNSNDYDFTDVKITKNTKIIRSSNIGNGAAINKALGICESQYAIYMDIDVTLPNNFINNFLSYINKIENFSVLIPNHGNLIEQEKFIEKYEDEASIMLFNLEKFSNKKIFDENFFLYYEETDLFFCCKKKKLKVFFIKDLLIKHERASSIDKEIKNINNLRSWHYMWSMFYFYKKNYSYSNALKKTYKFILADFIMIFFYILLFNKKKFLNRFYRLYGIFSSILGFRSFYR